MKSRGEDAKWNGLRAQLEKPPRLEIGSEAPNLIKLAPKLLS